LNAATFAGVFTNTIFGFLRAYVMIALYAGRGSIGGFDLRDTLTYTFVTQGMLMVVYIWNWWEIALTIRSGDVVTDFARPLDYELYWLAQDMGRATYHAIFRGIPPFVIGAIVFGVRLPAHPWTWLIFLISMYLAVAVSFAFRFMLNLSAFWLFDYRGIGSIAAAVWTFLSGFAVPIALFPGTLQTVARALPFAAFRQFLPQFVDFALSLAVDEERYGRRERELRTAVEGDEALSRELEGERCCPAFEVCNLRVFEDGGIKAHRFFGASVLECLKHILPRLDATAVAAKAVELR